MFPAMISGSLITGWPRQTTLSYGSVDNGARFGSGSWYRSQPRGTPGPKDVLPRTLGAYVLRQLIGGGSMGRVYHAEHRILGRSVALKVLNPELTLDPTAIRRFFAEARAVNRVRERHLVEITDLVHEKHGETYYVMELLEGFTLAEAITAGPIPIRQLVPLALQVCQALEAVHNKGIVHRDVKPDNIFVVRNPGAEDCAKLLDFGVAQLYDPAIGTLDSATEQLIGTPNYMSPEQIRGTSHLDHRADIYALGATLYEAATGRVPFAGATLEELLDKHLQAEVTPPSQIVTDPETVPAAFDRLITDCLNKDPTDRPQDIGAVAATIRRAEDQLARSTMTGTTPLFPERDSRRQVMSHGETVRVAAKADRSRRSRRSWAFGVMLVGVLTLALFQLSRPGARAPAKLRPGEPARRSIQSPTDELSAARIGTAGNRRRPTQAATLGDLGPMGLDASKAQVPSLTSGPSTRGRRIGDGRPTRIHRKRRRRKRRPDVRLTKETTLNPFEQP